MFPSKQEGSEERHCNEDNTGLDQGGGGVEGAVGALVGTAHLRKKTFTFKVQRKQGFTVISWDDLVKYFCVT